MLTLTKWSVIVVAVVVAGCDDEVVSPSGEGGGGSGGSTGTSTGGSNALLNPQLGDPKLLSAQRLEFGPGGVLLIGDGRTDRLVAVETGDTDTGTREENEFTRVDNVTVEAAKVIGNMVTAGELQVEDIAVNPLTSRTYVAVSRFSTLEAYVLWIDGDGDMHNFDLSNVVHAFVEVPPKNSPTLKIADMSWTSEFVMGAITPQTPTGSTIAFVGIPFAHEGKAVYASTRVYLRAFATWTTDHTLDRFFTFPSPTSSDPLVVASSGSTVVRFASADLADGQDHVTGTTVFDLGDGRTVEDFFLYERGDNRYAVAAITNLLFDGTAAVARFDEMLFTQSLQVNELSPFVFDFSGNPLVPGVVRIYSLDLATRMSPRGEGEVVILRGNSIAAVELP